MVSAPVLWAVLAVNFLALVLAWSCVIRQYPNFGAAQFSAAGVGLAAVGVAIATLLGLGVGLLEFNDFQAVMVLVLVVVSAGWVGFLLMVIKGQRDDVAEVVPMDDLAGVANRRHLMQRLSEQCALSRRTGAPFALLAISLDGFEEISQRLGEGVADECLRRFAAAAHSRLRPGDLLARVRGDEFYVALPATTMSEGATIARHLLETCRRCFPRRRGSSTRIEPSIGVAQWSPLIGPYPERLIAAADQALGAAKQQGGNRTAIYQPAPPLAPELESTAEQLMRLLTAG